MSGHNDGMLGGPSSTQMMFHMFRVLVVSSVESFHVCKINALFVMNYLSNVYSAVFVLDVYRYWIKLNCSFCRIMVTSNQ